MRKYLKIFPLPMILGALFCSAAVAGLPLEDENGASSAAAKKRLAAEIKNERSKGNDASLTGLYFDFARLHAGEGKPGIAYKYFIRAAGAARKNQDVYAEGIAYGELAYLLREYSLTGEAVDMFRKKIRLYKSNGLDLLLWDSYMSLGWIFAQAKDNSSAFGEFNNALVIARQKNNGYKKASCFFEIGKILYHEKEYQLANEYMSNAFLFFFSNNMYEELVSYYTQNAVLLCGRGTLKEAEDMLVKSRELIHSQGLRERLAEQYAAEGVVEQAKGDYEQAELHYMSSANRSLEAGDTLAMIATIEMAKEMYKSIGRERSFHMAAEAINTYYNSLHRSTVPRMTELKLAIMLYRVEPAPNTERQPEKEDYGFMYGTVFAGALLLAGFGLLAVKVKKMPKKIMTDDTHSLAFLADARRVFLNALAGITGKTRTYSEEQADFYAALQALENYLKAAPMPLRLTETPLLFFEERLKKLQKKTVAVTFDMEGSGKIRTDATYLLFLMELILEYFHMVTDSGGRIAVLTDTDPGGEIFIALRNSGSPYLKKAGDAQQAAGADDMSTNISVASYLIHKICKAAALELKTDISTDESMTNGNLIRIYNIGKT